MSNNYTELIDSNNYMLQEMLNKISTLEHKVIILVIIIIILSLPYIYLLVSYLVSQVMTTHAYQKPQTEIIQ